MRAMRKRGDDDGRLARDQTFADKRRDGRKQTLFVAVKLNRVVV
jgi:hypothetical protein